jgi:tetraacyldisaccharide 4'-kinase
MIGSWRPPSFWSQESRGVGGVFAAALMPVARAYGAIAARRLRGNGSRAALPVLCVGNLTVGGAGKTPTALALAARLIAIGEKPWFLSRGYGSDAEHRPPLRVDLAQHSAHHVGDEPLLLARAAPTLVSADRVAAARIAAEQGATVLILDDGLHNPALEKDLKLIVVDAAAGIGNRRCLPAGPLRAPLADQLEFADALLLLGDGAQGEHVAECARHLGKPIIRGRLALIGDEAAKLRGRRIYAFAGIGRPEKFFASLGQAGAELAGAVAFPDHHPYRQDEIARLQRAAEESDAMLVTTEKDFVRMQPGARFVDPALPAPVPIAAKIIFSDAGGLDALIERALIRAREGRNG